MLRFVRAATVIAAIAALSLVVLSAMLPGSSRPGVGKPAASPVPRPTQSVPPSDRRYDSGTILGPRYDADALHGPTRSKSQSKLWFNDGAWWAVMANSTEGEFRISQFDPDQQTWIDTGTSVDPRLGARMDVLWDGEKLLVLSAGSNPTSGADEARLYRFSYQSDQGRYFLDADFPVAVTEAGVGPITVARDSAGVLWAAYVVDGQVSFASSVGDDHVWNEPAVIPVEHTSVAADEAAVVSFGGRIGVMWSNQSEAAMYFASHLDGDPPDKWSPVETAVDERAVADNHVSVRSIATPNGPVVVAATKTSKDASPGEGPGSPQILLLVRDPNGTWVRSMVARVSDHHTRPALAIEEDTGRVHVFATSPFDGGEIFHKVARLDDLVFEPGIGETFLTTGDAPLISNVSVSKQNVSAATGLVVIASDDHAGEYVSRAVSLGDEEFPAVKKMTAGGETVVLHDSFAPFPAGGAAPGWVRTAGTATIAAGGDDNVYRLIGDADAARTCRQFAPSREAVLRATAMVQVDNLGSARSSLIKLRAGGSEVMAIRVRGTGTIDYAAGSARTEAGSSIGVNERLEITVELDPTTESYSARLISTATGDVLLDVSDVPVRGLEGAVDEICFEASPNSAPGGLAVDEVEVARLE